MRTSFGFKSERLIPSRWDWHGAPEQPSFTCHHSFCNWPWWRAGGWWEPAGGDSSPASRAKRRPWQCWHQLLYNRHKFSELFSVYPVLVIVVILSKLLTCLLVVQSISRVWLCYHMDCSTPGFPVLHYLPEFAQTYVHWVGDDIQPSNPLLSSSPLSSPFPASGSFPVSQFFESGGQSIGASASASVLPMNIQGWFPLGLTDWISLLSKGLSRVFSNTLQRHQFFATWPSLWSSSHICT